MDKKRATEIAASPVMAHVTHNGARVYIESVNGNNGTAFVHPIDQPGNRQEVSVNDLAEHQAE